LIKRSAIALLALCCGTAPAEEISRFALEFSRDQIPLNTGGTLDVDGMGIRFSEGSDLPLRLELALGYAGVSHNGDPAALGFQPDGYYLGITFGVASARWHALQLGADFDYSYHAADQQFNLQRLEIDWHRAAARGWLALQLNDIVKLYGCAIAVAIDGTQASNGGTPSQLQFKNAQRRGYCGGIKLEVGNDSYIGLEVERRHQRGGRLYFGRRYLF
jgi:hypothetical protein